MASASAYAAWVFPYGKGYSVACSCGYLVTGWPLHSLARADMDNHVARVHSAEDECESDDGQRSDT